MASIPVKGLLGLGAASSVVVGGGFLYKSIQNNSKYGENRGRIIKNIDQLAFDTRDNTTSLQWQMPSGGSSVMIQGTKAGDNSKWWKCNILGKTSNSQDADQFKTSKQIKESLGIQNNKTIKPEKINEFKQFVENCIRFRTGLETDGGSEVYVTIGDLEKDGDGKYKFKDDDLQKLTTQNLFDDKLKSEIKLPDDCLSLIDNPSGTCTLDKNKLKVVNFSNKEENNDLTINKEGTITLKIEKTDEIDVFHNGLKFIFETTQDIDIQGKSDSKKITLKTGKTEFKVSSNNSKFSLEEAWDRRALATKVNLTCTPNGGKTCSLNQGQTTNVYKSDTEYFLGVTFTENEKLTYEEGQSSYNGGLKLTVSGANDIALNKDNKAINKSLIKNGKSYEIGIKNIKGEDIWFLIEK